MLIPDHRRRAAVIVALFATLIALGAPSQAANWHQFSTKEFDVLGDASLSEMRRAAAQLEVYRYALRQPLPFLEMCPIPRALCAW